MVLFRRLVEHALEGGDEGGIKERTLGIEVFGREADYDTNTDPIVRMTANEIRKRLAQYYQSSSRHHEVHIGLVPGSYLPVFSFGLRVVSTEALEMPAETEIAQNATATQPASGEREADAHPGVTAKTLRRPRLLIALLMVVIVAAIAVGSRWTKWINEMRSNQYLLWAPLLETRNPVTICVADMSISDLSGPLNNDWASMLSDEISGKKQPTQTADDSSMPLTPFVDAEVSTRVAGWFRTHGKPFRLVRDSRTSLEDFRQGPVVLVGAFDNTWNLALFSKLRFHVQIDPVSKDEWIEDLQNPASREWKGSGKLLYSDSSVDYAIITRIFNKDTGTWFVAAGGLGMHATEAAGDLLTDPDLSQTLPAAVRSGNQNVQIVLKTTVIGGQAGAPQILAVYTW